MFAGQQIVVVTCEVNYDYVGKVAGSGFGLVMVHADVSLPGVGVMGKRAGWLD